MSLAPVPETLEPDRLILRRRRVAEQGKSGLLAVELKGTADVIG
jgi:hypothetical protein